MATKHLAVPTWLEALGLLEYLPLFQHYAGVEDLLNVGEREIRDLGVKNPPHRAKLISSLRILREKYQKGRGGSPGVVSPGHSYSPIPPPSPTGIGDAPSLQSLSGSSERLKADLERELSADPSQLKSRPWYHGSISRQRAEALACRDGDFLLRDCISKPGDFVLTCCWRGVPLHFMVNALVGRCLAGELPSVSYQFEEESFPSIQELIQHYMSQGKAVTNASSAVLVTPIARSMPLSYYDAKYGALFSLAATGHYTPSTSPRATPVATPTGSPSSSPRMLRRMHARTGSQPLLSQDDDKVVDRSRSPSLDRCDSMPVISAPVPGVPRPPGVEVGGQGSTVAKPNFHQRSGSEPVMMATVYSPCKASSAQPSSRMKQGGSDSDLSKPPPPKPSRIPSVKYTGARRPHVVIRNIELYEDDDRDYSDYMQVKEPPSWSESGKDNPDDPVTPRPSDVQGNVSMSGDIYDNNFNNLSKIPPNFCTGLPQIHLTPPSSEEGRRKPSRTRLTSDTRFSILDSRGSPKESFRWKSKENVIDADVGGKAGEEVLDNSGQGREKEVVEKPRSVTIPRILGGMSYRLTDLSSCLLEKECKPLEASVMVTLKALLLEHSPLALAKHCTKVDLDVLKVIGDLDLGVCVQSGLELLTLPQGKQLRQDIIERSHCCRLLVQVTVLTCSTVLERARLLSHWLDTAGQLKQNLGNLYGFVNVMEAVTSPQIQRLRDTWMTLRQKHTSSAFLYDSKLKSAFRSLGDGTSFLPLQDVCLPNVTPVACLLERDLDDLDTLLTWEAQNANLGLESMLVHLDTARLVASQWALFREAGLDVLDDLKEEAKVTDAFKTEFHLQLLWGSKGAGANRADRHRKFEQLVTILSNRAEPPGDDGTAV